MQLSHVKAGGATVFPYLDVVVPTVEVTIYSFISMAIISLHAKKKRNKMSWSRFQTQDSFLLQLEDKFI